jgi:hypothetical protein
MREEFLVEEKTSSGVHPFPVRRPRAAPVAVQVQHPSNPNILRGIQSAPENHPDTPAAHKVAEPEPSRTGLKADSP